MSRGGVAVGGVVVFFDDHREKSFDCIREELEGATHERFMSNNFPHICLGYQVQRASRVA